MAHATSVHVSLAKTSHGDKPLNRTVRILFLSWRGKGATARAVAMGSRLVAEVSENFGIMLSLRAEVRSNDVSFPPVKIRYR